MSSQPRTISVAWFAIIVIVYLAIVQGVGLGLSVGLDTDYGSFPDVETVVRSLTIPISMSVLFGIVVISVLRWWPSVLTENLRVQSWVWVVPSLYVVSALVVTDYANLADIDTNLLLTVVGTSLLVGAGEELMFRGISINALRDTGMREGRVALWSSVIFGAAHITNLFTEGPSAIIQVAVVSISGYFFYLMRRVSGTILVPIVVHAMWDFSLFSHNVGVDDPSPSAAQSLPMLATISLVIIVFVRRDKIEPAQVTA